VAADTPPPPPLALIVRLGAEAGDAARAALLDRHLVGASDALAAMAEVLEGCRAHRAIDPRASLAATEALAAWMVRQPAWTDSAPRTVQAMWVAARDLEATIRTGDLADHAGAVAALEAAAAVAGGFDADATPWPAEAAVAADLDADAVSWPLGSAGESRNGKRRGQAPPAVPSAAALAVARLAPRWVRALAFLDRLDEALGRFAEARACLEAANDAPNLARLHADLAGALWRAGRYDDAIEAVEAARSAYDRAGIPEREWLPALGQVEALAQQSLGRLDEAEAAFLRIIALCDAVGDAVRGASARTNLARVYFELGQPMRALALLDAASAVFDEAGLAGLWFMTLLVRMDVLMHLCRYRELLAATDEALAAPETVGTLLEWGQVHASRAAALAGLRHTTDALRALASARERFARAEAAYWVAECDRRSAETALDAGDAASARALASAALAAFGAQGARWDAAKCRLVVARAHLLDGDAHAALLALDPLDLDTVPAPVAVQGFQVRSRSLAMAGDDAGARSASAAALGSLEALLGRVALGLRGEFLVAKDAVYEHAVSLALDAGEPGEALALVERAKSRALVDALAHGLPLGLQPRSPEDARAVAEVIALRAEHASAGRAWRHAATGDDATRIEREFVALERRLARAWERLLVRGADYARQASVLRPFVADVRPQLTDAEVVLEYFAIGSRLLCFVVRKDAVAVRWLDATEADVDRLVERLRSGMRALAAVGGIASPSMDRHAAHYLGALYDALVRPLDDALDGAQRVIVVPHGPLHAVPFAALHDGTTALVERAALAQLPSSSLLPLLQRDRDGGQPTGGSAVFGLSLGGRLPAAVEEARAVGRALGVEPVLEDAASRRALLTALATRDVVHVASHAAFRADEPLYAGIEAADGMVTAMDLAQADVAARLVVLSGCETGASVVGGGDELSGLTSTLLARGAACVVVTRWSVDDAAMGVLMTAFYDHLARGLCVDRALAEAQRGMRRGELGGNGDGVPEKRWRHPFYWAGVAVVGDGTVAMP